MSTKETSPLFSIITGSSAAVFGDFCAFPIDTLKVRMQMHGSPLIATFRTIWAGGIPMFYRGVTASSFRQATYGGMRLSIYEPIRNMLTGTKLRDKNAPISLHVQIVAGALSGATSAAIMCPTDVLKIRMQGGEAQYRHVFDALLSIIRHEGVRCLWRGVAPTSIRASVVAGVELGLYDNIKYYIIEKYGYEGTPVVMASGVLATFGSILVSFPIDVSKTIMISQGVRGVSTTCPKETVVYRNMLDCLISTFRTRGLFGMYKGCLPSFARSITCNTVMFVVYEKLKVHFWTDI